MSAAIWLRVLREAPARLQALADEVQADIQNVKRDSGLSAEGKQAYIDELRDKAVKKAAAIKREAAEARESAEYHIARALKPKAREAAEALLNEQQETRAWERARRLLDAGSNVADIIEQAGASGDIATLRALRSELPSYLQATLVASAGPLRKGMASREASRQAEALLDAVDRAEAPHAPRERREALEAKHELGLYDEATKASFLLADGAARGQYNPKHLIQAAYATRDAERGLSDQMEATSA